MLRVSLLLLPLRLLIFLPLTHPPPHHFTSLSLTHTPTFRLLRIGLSMKASSCSSSSGPHSTPAGLRAILPGNIWLLEGEQSYQLRPSLLRGRGLRICH